MPPLTTSRPRAALLLALLALAALAAAVLPPPPPPVNAAPPGDLTLTLSLIEDSDDIVPPGGAARVRAALSSTTRDPQALVISGSMRVSGNQEWEHDGRNSFPVSRAGSAGVPGAATGAAVDVQQRSAAEGGDIVAVGAPNDVVLDADGDPINAAGSVDLFINGQFVKRLTAPTPAANARFGHAVAVGGGYIVVGAPNAYRAYVYDAAGEWLATFSPGTGINNARLGTSVAIDDAGETIVVGAPTGFDGDGDSGAAQVFLKPTGAEWASANSGSAGELTAYVVNREQRNRIGEIVAISGDGNVIIIGAYRRDTVGNSNANDDDENGGVLVFVKGSGWPTGDDETPNARLLAQSTRNFLQVGRSVDINYDGSVIVASGHGATSIGTTWKGAAFIWLKGSGAWSDKGDSDAIALTDSDSAFGDQFGHSVAISDSGNRVVVSNAWKQADSYQAGEAHIFDKPPGGWAADSAADTVLTSPQSEAQLFFGSAVALDGENTLVVGQAERTEFLATTITTGHGRAYGFDLAAANPQASAVRLDGGALPCTDRELNGVTTWTCPLDVQVTPEGGEKQDPRIIVPLGASEKTFTISAALTVDGVKVNDALEVTIGTVDEVDSASFDFATYRPDPTMSDEESYKDAIAASGDHTFTRMQLSILSSVGKATAAGNVSAVFFTSSGGTLSLVSSPGAATGSCADNTCQITVSSLNAANSDKITVQLAHPGPGKSGAATVRAHVISNAGKTLEPDAINVTFSGPVDTIAISEPATGVLNMNTTTGTAENPNDAGETRDRLRLGVSAQDKAGNKAATPTDNWRITITDPDGKTVSEDRIARSFPLTEPAGDDEETTPPAIIPDANDNPQLELDVNAPPTDKLKSGEYTIELRAGGKTTTQTFTVSGAAAAIALSEPAGELTVNGQFTITATLTDAAGATVPDGTPLSFEDNPTGVTPVLVNLSRASTTKDGQATATYLVITAGRGYVTVNSGTASNAALITTTPAASTAPTEPTNPADSLSTTRANAFTTWLGEATTTASELLESLDNGIDTILLWSNGRWTRYGIADGREIPDSINFKVAPGAILWLGNSS